MQIGMVTLSGALSGIAELLGLCVLTYVIGIAIGQLVKRRAKH